MSLSQNCVRDFYEHALAAILAVSVIHAMMMQSRILAVSAILAVSVARVIWRDSLAKIADTKIIGIDTQWDIWYNLSSVILVTNHCESWRSSGYIFLSDLTFGKVLIDDTVNLMMNM